MGHVLDAGFCYLNHKYSANEPRTRIRRVWNFITIYWNPTTTISNLSNSGSWLICDVSKILEMEAGQYPELDPFLIHGS